MNEIKCPKCQMVFKIDESGFAAILKQVRNQEFDNELHEREKLLKQEKENAVQLAEAAIKASLQKYVTKKETEIAELKAKIETVEKSSALTLLEAVAKVEKDRDALATEIKTKEMEKQLAVSEAVHKIEKERDALAHALKSKDDERMLLEATLKENHLLEIKSKEELISYYKDMKVKLSTKMVGESLEQHCETQFNQLRATAFPTAYFEKDNNAKTGSKGDYIYREIDENGVEIISIMFEMKNENDATVTKQKNEDFLKELDKDRIEKDCEYAVLVSLLETDSELYNSGIVDKSHRYPKMYVIRPQFFIPMITVLRNAALHSLQYKAALERERHHNIDITTFVNDTNTLRDSIFYTMKNAGERHRDAIKQIDSAIKKLQEARDALTTSDKHLLAAENKMGDFEIKRLTRKNPTMAEKLTQLNLLDSE